MNTRKIAYLGMLIAVAFVFSYIEFLIPVNIGIPGAKLGLANLVIIIAIYTIKPREAFVLSMIRILLVGFTFGNMAAMMYSFAGGMLSFLAMYAAKKTKLLSMTGVSVLGGVFHNIGQIIVAMIVLETSSLIYYLPFLLLVGTVSGIIIGIIASFVIVRIMPAIRW